MSLRRGAPMAGKKLTMENGDVVDDPDEHDPLCHNCQQPGAEVRALTGEWYHADCLPDALKG